MKRGKLKIDGRRKGKGKRKHIKIEGKKENWRVREVFVDVGKGLSREG